MLQRLWRLNAAFPWSLAKHQSFPKITLLLPRSKHSKEMSSAESSRYCIVVWEKIRWYKKEKIVCLTNVAVRARSMSLRKARFIGLLKKRHGLFFSIAIADTAAAAAPQVGASNFPSHLSFASSSRDNSSHAT